jgi:hypothetical protein
MPARLLQAAERRRLLDALTDHALFRLDWLSLSRGMMSAAGMGCLAWHWVPFRDCGVAFNARYRRKVGVGSPIIALSTALIGD